MKKILIISLIMVSIGAMANESNPSTSKNKPEENGVPADRDWEDLTKKEFDPDAFLEKLDKKSEKWECTKPFSKEVLVQVSALKEYGTGRIEVAGTEHITTYSVEGFDRKWSFDLDEEREMYNYSFLMSPDGTSHYYDFANSKDGRAAPSMMFICVKVQ